MKKLIKEMFLNYNIELNDIQISQFETYFNFLVEENQKYNLTAITSPEDVVLKHFIDSVLPYKDISINSSVVDIGTGAGFPGLPLKILRPDIKLTLVDSLQKRINFLNQLLTLLNIKDVETVHARAEDFIKIKREKFDIAVSRAVAAIPTLAEYLIPFVKIGGKIFMYKGINLDEELKIGQKAIQILGAKQEKILNFSLKEIESERKILILTKIKTTDKIYPRNKNLPKLKPIL